MATTNDLKNGMILDLEGQLWQVMEFQRVKLGKGPTFVYTKIKDILSDKTVDKAFDAGLRVETVITDRCDMQCFYKDDGDYVFMGVESCEQTYVPSATVGEAAIFMLGNQEIIVAFYEDSVLFAELSAPVVLMIPHTESGLQGDRSSAGTKPVTAETDAEIQVPLSPDTDDKVKVDTRSGPYVSRVND